MSIYKKLVDDINELRRRNKKNFITNSFFNMQQLKSMLDMESINVKKSEDVIIILNEEEQLIRLYFYATSLESLIQIRNILPGNFNKPVVAEIIGKGTQIENVLTELRKVNFKQHNKLIRMNRVGQEYSEKNISNVSIAIENQVSEIMDILYGEFDIYTSHLPTKEKLLTSIKNQEIAVVIEQDKIVGLAYFESLGERLNYLYQIVVDQKFRGQGIADSLLIYKFKHSPKDVACQLWVEINNQYAIDKYHKYNFVEDGLVDYIMIFEGV
ncbi:GNAT family N-acetyltransferase [Paenisporosarcina sp. NPDC076898]|uniref:GNAT family N-acetyltransferase n=1 Tax=unclassified Paenisporosarcina TaxID=2642018 RepID=UPI003D048C18